MAEATLRRIHRITGAFLAPLIVLQAVSGLFISFNVAFNFHHDVSAFLDAHEVHALHHAWDYLFMNIHYSGNWVGTTLHAAVGGGLVLVTWTGAAIFIRRVRRTRKARRAERSS
jgi:hypothetical protein